MHPQFNSVWMTFRLVAGLLLVLLPAACAGDEQAASPPEHVTELPAPLARAEQIIERAVVERVFPGAVLAVGREDSVAILRGIGRTSWEANPVDPQKTIYDVASLTKVVGTTAAVMLLAEDGRVDLDTPVQRYLPTFSREGKEKVTVRHLLTHTSGLPAGGDIWGSERLAWSQALATPLKHEPGDTSVYSDVGFVVLWAAAEQAAGEPLPELLERRIYRPLGMHSTGFRHGKPCPACAPTSPLHDASPARLHDPVGRRLGGVAGHAGLFSTGDDLARFAAMLAKEGELDGVRVFRPETVREFTRRQPNAGTRALGWDTPNAERSSSAGTRMSMRAFGHTGHTGGSIWIDPERGVWAVLLSNRTYNHRTGEAGIQVVRRAVNDLAAEAADAGFKTRPAGLPNERSIPTAQR